MWYLKVSSSLLIAVALICMIQNAISLTIDPKATEDQWSKLANSTDQNDLKKISKLCKVSLDNFNEKLENTKTIANKKLPEPNKTTEDIANLVSDIKNQVKNASADLVTVRKLIQKSALRFRDTFKSLVSFTELDSESVNKELESIKKTTVDSKKPLVNRVIRSFGNRYDLNKLANKVLEVSSDREKLKNNYNEKKKISKKEFNSLWNSLSNHSKTVNDNALKALETFFDGMKSVKSVKKKVKALGENALDEIKVGDDIIKLKNAVELAKSLKLKFEDEWNLDSGELTYSEEQKKPNTKETDDDQSDVQEKEKSNENIPTNDLEPGLPTTEQEPIENDKSNVIPPTQAEIEKLPIMDNNRTSDKAVSPSEETQLPLDQKNKDVTKKIQPKISETEHNPIENNVSDTIDSPIEDNPSTHNTETKDKTAIVQPEVSNKDQNSIDDDDSKSDSSIEQTSLNPDMNNNKVLTTPLKDSIDNKRGKRINKITSREKSIILPWEKLIQLDNPCVSQQSMKCKNLLNNVTPDFDNIKKAAKNLIQVTKNYKNLQNIENDTVKQFYDKMVDTNTKLCDNLVNAADDVCAKVTPINKRYETKFKNDPNIKRIKYLLGKQYDPNQYILKVLDDANHKNGIGGMKKTTYYKMLAVAHNLNHETKEMENAALYAMNKIHEGKLAAANIQKKFNKEKASKACYIRNILLEKENEDDKKNKDENKEKVKESINEDTNTEPLKPDVNLDSVDEIQPSTVNDDNEQIINNGEDTKTFSEPNEFTDLNNQEDNTDKINIVDSKNKKESIGQGTQEPNNSSSIPQNKDNDINTSTERYGNGKGKRNITRKITHHRKHRNPNDPNDVSEEYDSIEEIDDEADESNESTNNLEKIQNEIGKDNPNITSTETPEHIETEKVALDEENDEGINTSAKPKVKRYRKRIDPKDGKEITEEYETEEEEEEDDINSNKSGENKSNEAPESELLDDAENEHDKEIPEHLESEKVASDEENDEGINTSAKPKVKRYRKRIDPKDGKEITEEYETEEEEEEDDINSNKSGENKSNEAPESELIDNADNEHDKEIPEHLETEKVALDEENYEGINTSAKPKVKRYRKRIDPKDGKEITEEYETEEEEEEEEDDINSNKSGENKSNEAPESELIDNAENEHDKETPEHLESEKVASDEENDEGINTSAKPKVKRYRKRIDPKDGKEITEEYETEEEEEEDDINSNKSGENKSNEAPESELIDNAENEHDKETPEHLETEKVASDEENDEGINTSAKPKVKRYRKRIDPKDGKEITEEYETSDEEEEEEEDINSNKSGENKSNEAPESELLDDAENEHDKETPEHLESEKVASDEENDEGINTSAKPKVKRYRKRIDPKDGKEITEEYETEEEEEEEEDDINSNKSGENKSNEAPESELLDNAENEHDKETPEHLETEKVASDEENDEEINTSAKPKVKRYRKRIDPKDGKEITEEYETEEEEEEDDINSNKSGENKSNEAPESELLDNAENEHDKVTPEHLETEKVPSDEENDEGINTSAKPKVKRYRKRIDPKDGKEITEEYETEEEEEDDINSNKSGENKSNEAPESELKDNADNEHDKEIPEHLESENVASDEENDEEINTSAKPKVKRYRKRIDPKDGNEITEEYETSDEEEEEEEDINSNKSGENKSNEAPESELLDDAENEHDKETPEHLESEKVASDEENDEGINTSAKPKVKRYRKRIDPKDGKEITEEYETEEEEEEDDINSNKSGENKSNEAPESELIDNVDNEHDKEIPEHLESEKVASDEENDEGITTSAKPKVKRYRKRIDPKDGKEITEEYETEEEEEEDDINSNKSGENKSKEAPESELLDNAENEHDKEIPEHLVSEKVPSDEENDEGINTSAKPKVKRYRNRIDPKDGKEITEEYETEEEEEDDINSNKSAENKSNEAPETELLDNTDNEHEKETPERLETDFEHNDDNTREFTAPPSENNIADVDPENITKETVELDDNENLNSVEGAELNGVDNDNIIPAADSMGVDSSSIESNYDEPAQNYINDSNNTQENNNEQYNTDDQPNKISKHHRKRKNPKDGQEVSEEYDTVEEEEDPSTVESINNDTSSRKPDGDSAEHDNTDHEPETPEDEDIPENMEIPENDESLDHNQSNAPEELDENEPEVMSNEEKNKSNDIDQQNEVNQPHKKMRRHRKRKDPKDGQEVSEEYDPDEEQEDNSPVVTKNIDSPSGTPDGEAAEHDNTDHEPETPEDEDIPENMEIPENDESLDHNQSNAPEELDENEPEEMSNEEKNKSNDVDQQNEGNRPHKKMRRHRKQKDPKDGQEVSEEYDPAEEEEDNSPVVTKNIDSPSGTPDGEAAEHDNTDHEPETPEDEDIPENMENPENDESLDHNQSNAPEELDENEPEEMSNEEKNKSNDVDQQNEGNRPHKKMRRHRKQKDPKDGQEVSEEFDPAEEEEDHSPVESINNDTPSRTPYGDSAEHDNTDHEPETPEDEDIPENMEIPENDENLDQNQSNAPEELDDNEHEVMSNEEKNKSNDIDQQNEGYQPHKKMRRHRKQKDPKDGQEVSEEYDPAEEEEDHSPAESINNDTPSRTPDGDSAEHDNTNHEPETPEDEDIPENMEIPENDENLDQNQSNAPEELDDNEPEIMSNEEKNKSNDVDQQKDPKDSQEVSEEYDPDEEQEDHSPLESINNDTPSRTPDGDSAEHDNTDHEPETPEDEDIPENMEIPENDESLDHNQSNSPAELDENEPEVMSNEEKNKSNDVDKQNEGNQPHKKMRRHRKRKDPKDGQEVSEEYDPDEEQGDNSPVVTKNIDSPSGTPDGEAAEHDNTDHEPETPEDEDIPENMEIPENDESLDHNQSNSPAELDENEPEVMSNEEKNKSNDFDQQNEGNQPHKKMRRHRKRKDPMYDQEISEEYDTVEEEEDEPPVVGNNIETPIGNAGEGSTVRTKTDNETPEYDGVPDFGEIPETGKTPDHNQSNTELDEDDPKRYSNEVINKSSNFDEQNNEGNQPHKKMRRHRKRKDPMYDQEISEEYDTVEEEEDEPPVVGNNIETPIGNAVEGSTVRTKTDNETPEYDGVPDFGEIPETGKTPEYNQSNTELDEDEPKRYSNEVINKSSNFDEQNNEGNKPNKTVRCHRNRKDPMYDQEISEEYDTVEEEEDDSPVDQRPYPKNAAPKASSPNDVDETINVAKPRPRKFRRHRKSRQPNTINENENEPEVVNDDNNVQEELPETGNGKTTDIGDEIEQPELSEYPENSVVAPEASSPNDVDETMNVAKPRKRKFRRHRKSRQPNTINENENEPEVVNDDNNVQEELPETGNGKTTDIGDDIEQPELSEYPENSDVAPEASSPNDVDEAMNVAKPRKRKFRRHRKSRQPNTINENENEPEVVNDDNNVQEELPETGNGKTTDIGDVIEQPELSEYPENSVVAPESSSPNDVDETMNVAKPRPRKFRRHRKTRQPKTVNENYKETEDPKRILTQSNEHANYPGENEKTANLNDTDGKMNSKQPRRKKHVRRKKIPTTLDDITPNSVDTENRRVQNDEKSVENPETQPNDTGRNPKKKRRLRRVRTYMVNKATNERIPINDQTYSTTDGLPDTPKNKLEATEIEDSDDPDSNEDSDDYSSFLFKEYNSDQCKRDAYDRFKKVTSQDAKQIAYRSVLDTSEMRSNMLATIKNAIGNVKVSKTLNDVDQSLRTVSYSLKTGLKQTVSDLVTKVIPLAKDFLNTAENLKELYKNGPQSTHKMLSNILENESTVPDSAKDVLKLISPQFDVDQLINNIFEKPINTKSLKEKKAKAQRKLIGLSKHMDTAISNIDCFVLSAMSAVGIGADTLKLLKSGRVIMSDKHPRSKALRDAVGIIKSGKKIRNNDTDFTPTLAPPDGFNESDEDDDDEDPDQVAQKNEEFLKTVPDLDDNIPVPKKVPNKRQSLGVIVVHPNKQIEYKEVTDTSQLKKFVGDQTKKYKLQSKNKHPKFLKLNSKKLIDSMVADVKKKAERNGMSKKEMVEEIIKNLNSS